MSDARPITNVTDFVCGTCWNSFSRKDPGVEQAGRLICPHCGHALAAELAADPLAAVRNAPTASDSDLFGHAHASDDEDLPIGANKPLGWASHENVARSAEPAGFVVGAPDNDFEDFDFNEATLRPDVSHDSLLAAVRATAEMRDPGHPAAPKLNMAAAAISAGHVVGIEEEEFSGDTSEPTPSDFAEAEATVAEDAEARDWKLKAIGLTYNFHGLDALIGWASNKAGQSMQISMDGQNWKDFDSFFTAYRAGVPAAKAFGDALEPGATKAAGTPAAAVGAARGTTAKSLDAAVPNKTSVKPEPGRAQRNSAQLAKPDAGALGAKGNVSAAKNLAPNRGGSRRVPVAAAQNASQGNSKTTRVIAIAVAAVVVVGVVAWKLLAK